MEAVKKNGNALQYASAELQGDRNIVMAAIKSVGSALKYASAELKGDREIVMVAVKQDGLALEYASAELKGELEIVTEAVATSKNALQYASDEVINGGFQDHLNCMMQSRFNVMPGTFISTILFGARASPAALLEDTEDDGNSAASRSRLGDIQSCFLSLLQPSTVLPRPLSIQLKRLIWDFAGVRSGPKWRTIEAAEQKLHMLKCEICGDIAPIERECSDCGESYGHVCDDCLCDEYFECECDRGDY